MKRILLAALLFLALVAFASCDSAVSVTPTPTVTSSPPTETPILPTDTAAAITPTIIQGTPTR